MPALLLILGLVFYFQNKILDNFVHNAKRTNSFNNPVIAFYKRRREVFFGYYWTVGESKKNYQTKKIFNQNIKTTKIINKIKNKK